MAYIEIQCASACNRLKRKHPYLWDLNIYRGCEHGCRYCYAMYSNQYMASDQYFKDIYVKTNIAEKLEKELASPAWKREVVNIGGVTDSYQPAEAQYRLMPDILRLLIKYETPAIISTKSDLILRDFDLLDQLSRVAHVNIAATITTVDEEIRKQIEPLGVSADRRFKMLKAFRQTKVTRGLHIMPVIPYITDSYANMDGLLSNGKEAGVQYVLPGVLYLIGETRAAFFHFIRQEYPALFNSLAELYNGGGAGKAYKAAFYQMYNERKEYYGLSSSYIKIYKEMEQPKNYEQLSLFDL